MLKQMKIFQIGYADSGLFIPEDAFQDAIETFRLKPVVRYDESKTDYSPYINELIDEVIGIIKSVDYIDNKGNVFGTIDLYDRYEKDLKFTFRNYQINTDDFDKESCTANSFIFEAVYIS